METPSIPEAPAAQTNAPAASLQDASGLHSDPIPASYPDDLTVRICPQPDSADKSITYDLSSLEAWCAWYEAAPRYEREAFFFIHDELDLEEVERGVQDAMQTIAVTKGLCFRCHNVMKDWPEFKKRPREHRRRHCEDTRALEASVRKGCRLCNMLFETVQRRGELQRFRIVEQRLRRLGLAPPLRLVICDLVEEGGLVRLEFLGAVVGNGQKAICSHRCENIMEPVLRERFLGSSELSTSDKIKYWMGACCEEHKECVADPELAPPTRLLDIASKPPKLILSAGEQWSTRPRYATLSHCWGGRNFFRLQKHNMAWLSKKGLPMHSLTKTFRDAIAIARAADLDYLWIDSLCIIQDDSDDWERESLTMNSVYSGSSLNIAAASAKNGFQGCFLRPKNFCEGFHAEVIVGGHKQLRQFECDGNNFKYFKVEVASHLATRAWCVQERLLAPRTLHCGDRGFFWECREHLASQDFPLGYLHPLWDPEKLSYKSFGGGKAAGRTPDTWKEFVELYMVGSLTFSSDKLVACAGVARAASEANGFEYLAGMWRPWLFDLLYWEVDRFGKPSTQLRPSFYRAPSWSWAAVDSIIHFAKYSGMQRPFGHVLDASVTPAGADLFGQVIGGFLRLCCSHIVPGTLRTFGHQLEACFHISGSIIKIPVRTDFLHEELVDVAAVLLPLQNEGSEPGSGYSGIKGLVLQSTGLARGEYCRIGSFTAPFHPGILDHLVDGSEGEGEFDDIIRELRAKMPELARKEKCLQYPDAPFVIDII